LQSAGARGYDRFTQKDLAMVVSVSNYNKAFEKYICCMTLEDSISGKAKLGEVETTVKTSHDYYLSKIQALEKAIAEMRKTKQTDPKNNQTTATNNEQTGYAKKPKKCILGHLATAQHREQSKDIFFVYNFGDFIGRGGGGWGAQLHSHPGPNSPCMPEILTLTLKPFTPKYFIFVMIKPILRGPMI
jgi:hypothetical protein